MRGELETTLEFSNLKSFMGRWRLLEVYRDISLFVVCWRLYYGLWILPRLRVLREVFVGGGEGGGVLGVSRRRGWERHFQHEQ